MTYINKVYRAKDLIANRWCSTELNNNYTVHLDSLNCQYSTYTDSEAEIPNWALFDIEIGIPPKLSSLIEQKPEIMYSLSLNHFLPPTYFICKENASRFYTLVINDAPTCRFDRSVNSTCSNHALNIIITCINDLATIIITLIKLQKKKITAKKQLYSMLLS